MKKPPETARVIVDVAVCSSVAGVNGPTSARPDVTAALQKLHSQGHRADVDGQGKS